MPRDFRTFLLLCTAVYIFEAFRFGSLLEALGGFPIDLLASLAVGGIALWFLERIYLFFRNITQPTNPKYRFERSIWQHLSLALVVGGPLYLALGSLGPNSAAS